ncbi:hypothetical protein OIU84_004612 [Salix udensis]|uniref:B-like cyclin n=1 Tax=Salix udensis TaxID=889485 RepID=A0AAD6P4D7_9ROSI|nr:hypothetical protein OIU84_004612 [Salix udensis]
MAETEYHMQFIPKAVLHTQFIHTNCVKNGRNREEQNQLCKDLETNPSLARARCEAVEWILKVNAHYSFTALTAVLAVNYLDRFLSSVHLQKEKPWMTQLAAVFCLSLAAKVEETQVPLLLDFQRGEGGEGEGRTGEGDKGGEGRTGEGDEGDEGGEGRTGEGDEGGEGDERQMGMEMEMEMEMMVIRWR